MARALSSWTPSALAKACEVFVTDGVMHPNVRPEVAASWKRCRVSEIFPDKDLAAIPLELEIDRESCFMLAALPVLTQMAERLSETATSIILTDPSALVLDRWVGEPGLHRMLDGVALVAGAPYGEEVVGTNGLGTTMEVHKPTQVTGPEHFVEALRAFTCAGVPIRHPVTGRVEGVLDITCRYEDTNSLMLPTVLEGARMIEQRLLQEASACEQLLLEEFQRVASRSTRPVVAMTEQVVLSNTTAAGLLEPADHAVLRERAAEVLAGRKQVIGEVLLSGGTMVSLRCHGVTAGKGTVGTVLEFGRPISKMSRTRQTRTRVRPASLVGRSTAYERLCAEIDHHAGHRLPLLITGEPGVGKLAVATAVHECGGTSGPVSVHDAALCEIDEPSDWLGTVRTRLADPTGTVIILHGDLLDTARARALCGVIDTQSRPGGARLIATWTNGTQEANGTRFMLDRLPCSIDVPPLRDHPEDVPDLVHAFIDRHAPAGATARSSADVLQVLMRLEWPGNIRELECLICNLLLRRRQGDITLEDLPPRYQSTGARTPLTRMERLERDAIVTALRACGGNRIESAANLGISRSTLYRKMKGYRISTVGVQTFDS